MSTHYAVGAAEMTRSVHDQLDDLALRFESRGLLGRCRKEARITPHGGPHWTKYAASIAELEAVALEALATDQTPPSDGWMRA
jgi:hypothetical protein